MANLTHEMIEKAKTAKTAEELMALAKENGVELTDEEATAYFTQLNPTTGELADDELDNVAGGGCGSSSSSSSTSTETEQKLYYGSFYDGSLVTGPLCCTLLSKMNGSAPCTSCVTTVKNTIHFLGELTWEIYCPVCGQRFQFSVNPKSLGFYFAQ